MSDTKSFPLHQVLIDRDKSVLAVQVPKHEIDVLRAVHGLDRVQDKGEVKDDDIELNPSAEAEWARLHRKYDRINAPDYVSMAHRAGPRALAEYGFSMDRGSSEPQQNASVRKRTKKTEEKKPDKAK